MSGDRGRDLRRYARSTQARLVIGAIALLIVGDGLVWWLFGWPTARSALICTGFGLLLALLVAAWFWLLSWFARRAKGD
jgi:hypothetical protein